MAVSVMPLFFIFPSLTESREVIIDLIEITFLTAPDMTNCLYLCRLNQGSGCNGNIRLIRWVPEKQ